MRYFCACAATRFHFHSIGSDQFWIRAVNARLKFVELAREKVQERNEKKRRIRWSRRRRRRWTGAGNAFLPHKQNANTNISFCARWILFIFVLVSYWSTIAIALLPTVPTPTTRLVASTWTSASAPAPEARIKTNKLQTRWSLNWSRYRFASQCIASLRYGSHRNGSVPNTYICIQWDRYLFLPK